MGCFCSKYLDEQPGVPPTSSVKRIVRPVWKSQKPWTEEELQVCARHSKLGSDFDGISMLLWRSAKVCYNIDPCLEEALVSTAGVPSMTPTCPCLQAKREEYWDTQPHYGGDKGDCRGAYRRFVLL